MIKDLWNAIRLYIEDRLSSPLLTGFIFAWSIINYRFFLIVFSSERFAEKIELIAEHVFPTSEDKLFRGVVYPLVAALVYVLIYPFVDRLIFRAWRWHQHKLVAIRQKIDGERPLSEEDKKQLLGNIANIRQEYEQIIGRLNTTIESQQVQIRQLTATASSPVAVPLLQAPTPTSQPTAPENQEPLLDQPLTLSSLSSYVSRQYPNKPIGQDILQLLLNDIDKERYSRIRDIDDAVQAATSSVLQYETEKPELFSKGADYLTKSLGFVDLGFRKKHAFGTETRNAFARIGNHKSASRTGVRRKADEELEEKGMKRGFDRESFRRDPTKKRALLRLSQLRGDGVEIRNKVPPYLYTADLDAWESKVIEWMNEAIGTIKAVSEEDSLWFATLDTVPPARVPIPNIRLGTKDDRERFVEIFKQHDYRLKRLEDLLRKHGVGA